jgi:hypothetical protein
MPSGTISDPKFNQNEEDYGILVDGTTGHYWPYLKDLVSQYLTHGTPVEYGLVSMDLIFTGKSDGTTKSQRKMKIPFAIIRSVRKDLPVHSAAYRFNELASSQNWKGKADPKDYNLNDEVDTDTNLI